jgi:hypothetical protein
MKSLPRRTLLRGAFGTALGLPFLEAMRPRRARAAEGDPPRRVVFLWIPVGFKDAATYSAIETPSPEGLPYTLPDVLSSLTPLQSKITLVGNIENHACEGGNGDAHERGTASMLTCMPSIQKGSVIQNGISIDQLAAQSMVGPPLASLELGVDESATTGKGVMFTSIAWRADGTPVPKEINPGRLWDRLFTDLSLSPEELARKRAGQSSVLSYARESANGLRSKLPQSDRIKLDQYLTGIEALEARTKAAGQCAAPLPGVPLGRYENDGSPENHNVFGVTARHDLMLDLLVHALACDITRVATFMFAGGSYADWRFLGFQDEHHLMSHFPSQYPNELDAICRWEMERLAAFLTKLDAVEEADGTTLLDNTLVFLCTDVSEGEAHNYTNMPIILAGGGNKVTKMGQSVRAASETPLANVYTSMMQFLGVENEKFGLHGTGPFDALMV